MTNDVVSLNAESRNMIGTGPARALRREGKVPVTVYGTGHQPLKLSVPEKDITKHYFSQQFVTQTFELKAEDKSYTVLPKAVQLHPVKDVLLHVDFVFLEKDKQKLFVPIVYKGKADCSGVKRGGYFNVVRRTLKILCPVGVLPRKLEIDVTHMSVNARLRAGDIPLPAGAILLDKPEFVVASITGKKGKADDDKAVTGGPAAAAK